MTFCFYAFSQENITVNLDDDIYSLTEIFMSYFTEDLTDEYRAAYFMTNRLGTNGTRAQVRNAVYTEYLSNKLISTLESFKIKAEVTNICRGPSVTRYELVPDAGVRINKITAGNNLSKNTNV